MIDATRTQDSDIRGLVFDVQRFALHDGPGIRTTVFLKGCPLRCLWCHNPESQSFQPQISLNAEKCMHCMSCVAVCTTGAQQDRSGKHAMDHARCRQSRHCLSACAHGALSLVGEERSVADVLAVVCKDEAYYQRSGGGLTVSGGEPMSQFPFTQSLLFAAKERGLHTCLDTSGFVSWRQLATLLPAVDLFLYDYKATDPDEHRKLTGVSNQPIVENLDRLYKQNAQILLRCPLIPGLNDSTAHLRGIASLSTRYPDLVGVEIMPYHNMGSDKAARVGQVAPLADLASADEAMQDRWLRVLHDIGCTRAQLG